MPLLRIEDFEGESRRRLQGAYRRLRQHQHLGAAPLKRPSRAEPSPRTPIRRKNRMAAATTKVDSHDRIGKSDGRNKKYILDSIHTCLYCLRNG